MSYKFTKKRPSKICEIEKINRQTTNKMMLILIKLGSLRVRTLT